MVKFCDNRCIAILLITLFVFASSGKTFFSGLVLCVRGSDHVALEFEHNGHVSLSGSPDAASANSHSMFGVVSQQEADDRCLDIPVSVCLARQSVTTAQPGQYRMVFPAFGASTPLSSPRPLGLYIDTISHPLSFQTTISLSLHTTVLLI